MLTLLCLLLATPKPADATVAVSRMQAFYEKTKDLTAHFEQTYLNEAFHKTLKSEGVLKFKKPGMIRFDYEKPEPKFFVVKDDKIVTYIPEAQQAMVGSFKADQLSASVTFLWGRGKLSSEFDVKPADRTDLSAGIAVELTPKKPDPRLQKIFFVVDPVSYAVKESVVVDGSGNENRFEFSEIRPDVGLSAKDFDYALPKDTQILKTP